ASARDAVIFFNPAPTEEREHRRSPVRYPTGLRTCGFSVDPYPQACIGINISISRKSLFGVAGMSGPFVRTGPGTSSAFRERVPGAACKARARLPGRADR